MRWRSGLRFPSWASSNNPIPTCRTACQQPNPSHLSPASADVCQRHLQRYIRNDVPVRPRYPRFARPKRNNKACKRGAPDVAFRPAPPSSSRITPDERHAGARRRRRGRLVREPGGNKQSKTPVEKPAMLVFTSKLVRGVPPLL